MICGSYLSVMIMYAGSLFTIFFVSIYIINNDDPLTI